MGRYAYGDDGFEYKYAFGDQSADLIHLASLSGVGRVALFWKLDVEGADEIVFREETTALAPYEDAGEAFASRAKETLEALRRGTAALDADLERPLGPDDLRATIRLTASATYEIDRDEWPALLEWVGARIPPRLALTLDDLTEESAALARASSTLDPAEPLDAAHDLALAILVFAAEHDLDTFCVEDGDPIFDALVHDPAAPVPELEPSINDGPSYEREVFDAYARRPDGIVLTPPPKSRGQEDAVETALAELEAQTTALLLVPARERLEAGDGGGALPYLIASLQRMPPSWARGRAVRGMMRRALSLADGAEPNLDALWDVLERSPSFDLELAVVHRLAHGHGLDRDVAAALTARTYADSGARKRGRALARAVFENPDASPEGRATAALALAELAEARGSKGWQRRWLARALEGPLPDRFRHEALRYLGELHEEAGRNVRALHCYDEAVALRPGLAFGHFRRGFVLDLLGRPRAAINAYTRALRIDPTFENARFNRACEHARVGNVDAALRDLADAIAHDPDQRASARKELYFTALRADPRFRKLVGKA